MASQQAKTVTKSPINHASSIEWGFKVGPPEVLAC